MRNPGSNNKTSGNSLWMKTVGEDFIVKAFEYARKYAPADCKLFYNDYNEYEDKKMGYIVNILTNLKAKGLVDGMGMQSHWIMEYPSISMVENAVRKYNSLGLEVQLTEIDIKNTDNSASGLERQAERYQQFITKIAALKKEGLNITALVFWGVTDATSWLGGYPLLFNGEYKAKPAFYSIVKNITPIATSTVTPTATPKITPTPSSIVIGDVDGNKAVNSIDFGWVRKYLLGLSNSFPAGNDGLIAADVNGDGSINSLDYGWMRSKLLGMIEKFPAEE